MSTTTAQTSAQSQHADGAVKAGFRQSLNRWLAPITIMTFILGAFIALALKAQNVVRSEDLPSSRYSGLAEAYMGMKTQMLAYQATIHGLQQTNERLNRDVTARAPQTQVLNDQVNQARFIAGLTDVQGPGVVVTLNDSAHHPTDTLPASLTPQVISNFIIHDVDIQRVLNELKAGGAEAFSVNNQRIVANTAVRCVGPAIQINGVPITPPYHIKAIGDPDTLATSMNLPGGIADQLKSTDPAMIAISKSKTMQIPAYDGATQFRYAKPRPETSNSASSS